MARSFADEMTIDPETGLPALPEGHAWEVSRGGDRLYVSLKKSYTLRQSFWAKLLGKKPLVEWDEYVEGSRHWEFVPMNFLNGEGILMVATSIYKTLHENAVKVDELDAFVGMYPPKSIL